MKYSVPTLLGACLLTLAASAQQASNTRAAASIDIRGVWTIAELASRAPGAEWEVRAKPYASQYIFTDKHYSYLYVLGSQPRKKFAGDPNKPTDAEKVEAYNTFVAATGTYALTGDTLTLNALVHKNPNEMSGEPLVYELAQDGNSVRMIVVNPPFLPGREWRTVLTKVN